ncbi:MAG: tetratricopeptide repeat protein [Syntrophothermus sp.]
MEEPFDNYPDPEILTLTRRFEKMMLNGEHYFFDVDEYEEIIDFYLFKNDNKKANSCIHFALEQHPGNVNLLLRKAQMLISRDKTENALQILNDLDKYDSTDHEVHLMKGNLYSQLDKPEKAIEEYLLASRMEPEDLDEIYSNISFEYENIGKYEKAIDYLILALENNPSNEGALYEISFCFEISQQTERAVRFLEKYLDNSPFSKAAWFNLGIAYSNLELYEKAIEAYDYAIAIDETFASAYFNKANCYANLNEYKKAIETYLETAFYEDPEPLTYYYIAECFEKMEDYNAAITYYKKAISLDPDFADAWLGIGMAHDALVQYQLALTYIEKAIAISPTIPDYWFIQGDIQIKFNRINDGIKSYLKVIEMEPENSEIWLELSIVYSDLEDYDKAESTLREGIKWHESNPDFYFSIAFYLLKLGKTRQAYEKLDKAMSLDPEGYQRMFDLFPEMKDNANVNGIIETYKQRK